MEHRGLVQALEFLANSSVQIKTLVTDRHKQIAKYMREHNPSIDHRYDVRMACLKRYQLCTSSGTSSGVMQQAHKRC